MVLHLGLSTVSTVSGVSIKAMATADWDGGTSSMVASATFLLPDTRPWWRGAQLPSLEQFYLCWLPPSQQGHLPSQKGPSISKSAQLHVCPSRVHL